MIHTVGDSHAQLIYRGLPGVVTREMRSPTMYRVGRPDDTLIADEVLSLNLTPADVLIIACGEIDCRVHIKKQIELQGVSLEALAHELVDHYIAKAKSLPNNGARVAITAVPPPVPTGKIYHAGVLLPLEGSDAERVAYTTTLNRMLAAGCAANGLAFVDVYTPYADADGLLRPELSDGSVHIRQNDAVGEELHRLGIL